MSDLQLVPGTLPSDLECYQTLYDEMFSRGHAVGPNVTGLLIQDSVPDPEDHDKGWIPTSGGVPIYPGFVFVWHPTFSKWVSRNTVGPADGSYRIYTGTAASLSTYDGGDVNAPGLASGPMWEIATAFEGRVPIGVGTIPTSSPAASIANPLDTTDSLGNSGEYKHTLTGAEGAVKDHVHPIGVADPSSDDAFFNVTGPPSTTVPSYTAHYITGSGHGTTLNETSANLYTLKANDGNGVTSDPHNNMMPYVGVYFIKRTARAFYVAA